MLEIHFHEFLNIRHFVQLSIEVLHKSPNIHRIGIYRDMKLCRKRGTELSCILSTILFHTTDSFTDQHHCFWITLYLKHNSFSYH